MPDEKEGSSDPRFDRHGFRRDARNLEREEAFETTYAARLEQQEQRWGRHTGRAEEQPRAAIPFDELKRLVRLGIPAKRRGALWPQLARAEDLRATEAEGYFESLLASPDASPGGTGFAAERQIDLDLARTFPGHRQFAKDEGASNLRRILVAYARRNPRVGYVQGMGFVAALLLIFIDDPEEAFWCFVAVIEWLLPEDFYSPTLLGLRTEQAVFNELVSTKLPRVSKQLQKHGVVAELFATRWFVAVFANSLPIETTLRVWDAFLLEGCKVLHRIGLALLRIAQPRLLACTDQQELLCAIQEEQAGCLDCERLMSLAFDSHGFLRSFPRSRMQALRRLHRARLLLAEQQSPKQLPPQPSPPPLSQTPRRHKRHGKKASRAQQGQRQQHVLPVMHMQRELVQATQMQPLPMQPGSMLSTSAETVASSSGLRNVSVAGVSDVRLDGSPSGGFVPVGLSPRSSLLPPDEAGSSDEDDGVESVEGCSSEDGYEILSVDDLPSPAHTQRVGSRWA